MAAVAPGVAGGKLRATKVVRKPYWVPWEEDGAGGIRLVPADRTHRGMLENADGTMEPYYQSKGMIPLHLMPPEHRAHEVFTELCRRAVARALHEHAPVPDWVPPSIAAEKPGAEYAPQPPAKPRPVGRKPQPVSVEAPSTLVTAGAPPDAA